MNQNLTSSQVVPGFYGSVDYDSTAGAQAPNLRCLIWGFLGASATAQPNQPFRASSQSDLNTKAGGSNTDLARFGSAATSQPEALGADIWYMGITPPAGGVASVYTWKVFVGNTNPAKSGTIQGWICSQQLPAVGFSPTDTATTIAAALGAAIASMPNLPIASCTASSGVITVTYIHKGAITGEDLPARFVVSPSGSGVNVSCAQIACATSASGAGSVLVNVGAISISTALTGSETAGQAATKIAASINASSYPITAVVDGTTATQVDIYFNGNNGGWDVRRLSAAVITSTGLTLNMGSGATDGAGSPTSLTYNGTLGTGAPSLGSAITALTNQKDWYRSWVSPWVDTSSLGTMATYIEAGSNGSITGQKLQTLTVADYQALSVDGALPTGTSPNLTTSNPHYAFGWAPDCSVQACELAARVGAARAAIWIDTPQKNWNGFQIKGNAQQSPILLPPTVPSVDAQNTALRTYGLSPWIAGPSGNIEIVKGRTTSLATDMRLWSWSCEAQAAYHWQDLQAYYARLFQGGSIVKHGPPKAQGLYDANSFEDATRARLRVWESQGNYDGADAFADAVVATPNRTNVNRVDVTYVESPVLDLDQVVFTGYEVAPSA